MKKSFKHQLSENLQALTIKTRMSFFHAWASLCLFHSRAATTGGIHAPTAYTLVASAFPAFRLRSSCWICNVRAACITIITRCKNFFLSSMRKPTTFPQISSRCWKTSLRTSTLLIRKDPRERKFTQKPADHEAECLGIQCFLPHLLLRLTCMSLDVRLPSSDLLHLNTELTRKIICIWNRNEAVRAILLCKASKYTSSVEDPDAKPWLFWILGRQERLEQDVCLESRVCMVRVVSKALLHVTTSPHLAIAFVSLQFMFTAQNRLVLGRTYNKIVRRWLRYLSNMTSGVFHCSCGTPGRVSYIINFCPFKDLKRMSNFVKYFATRELTIQKLTDEQHKILHNAQTNFNFNSLFHTVLHKRKYRHFLRMNSVKRKSSRCHQRQLKLKDLITHSNQAMLLVVNFGSSVLHEGDNNFWQLRTQQQKRHTRYREKVDKTSSKKFLEKREDRQTCAKCSDKLQSQNLHRKTWLNLTHDKDHDQKVQKEGTYYRQHQNLKMSSILHHPLQDAQLWIVCYGRHQDHETTTNNDQERHTHLENCVIQQVGNSGLKHCQKHEGQINLSLSKQMDRLLVLTPTCRLLQAKTAQMYTGHKLGRNAKLKRKMQQEIRQTNMTRNSQRVTRQINVTHTVHQLKGEHVTEEDRKKHTTINASLDESRGGSLPARSSAAWGANGQEKGKCRSTACGHREHQRRGIIHNRSYGDMHAEETTGLHPRCCSMAGQVGDAEDTTIAHCTSRSKRSYISARSKQKQPNDNRVCCSQYRLEYARKSLCCEPTPSIIIRVTLCSLLFCAPFAVSLSPVVVGVYIQGKEKPQAVEIFNRTLDVMLKRVEKMLPGRAFIIKMLFEQCISVDSMDEFIQMNQRLTQPVDVLIGPTCNWLCSQIISPNQRWTSAVISYKSCSHLESSIALSRIFLRTTPSFQEKSYFLKAVLEHYRWDYVTIVTALESYAEWSEKIFILENILNEGNSIDVFRWTVELTHEESFVASAETKMQQSRICIWLMSPAEVIRFHSLLYKIEFFRQGYAFFTFDFANYGRLINISTSHLINMTGLLDITIDSLQDKKKYGEFVAKIRTTPDVSYLPCKHDAIGTAYNEFADAILLMGHCINLTLQTNSNKKCNLINLHNKTFEGATDNVRIDENGFRVEKLVLNNLVGGCYFQVGWFDYRLGQSATFNLSSPVIWPGDTDQPPTVKPKCGWNNDECGLPLGYIIAIVIGVFLGVTGLAVLLFLMFRKIKARRDHGSTDWIIKAEKLYAPPVFEGKAGAITGSTKHFDEKTRGLRGRLWSLVSHDSLKGFSGITFTKVALINGQLVAVKSVMKESIVVTSDITKEVNKIRRLKHSNVNQLIGACVETGHISLLWVYCHKGSLENVLLHAGIKLDVIFNISFISDIVRGMTYLHESPVGRHGRLKSSNVLVDSNWSCRVSDMAMPFFREDMLWTAPELLRDVARQRRGTQKGDVYAFAIIMQEIILRTRPYGIGEDDNAREIVQRVRRKESPPLRPVVPRSAADENLLAIMYLCWDDFEQFRPSFPIISEMVKHVRRGLGPAASLVDQMLHMLSKYADNLEELVEDRTTKLEMEQKKTEELLCRMLPKSVAMNLKLGNEVVPESFSAVTIYFSDIVGFTSLAASSTPMQVVDLLNDLYTCFDTIIESFDVYKVETIGDAYMVVSGLPVRNGDLHAGEIATMSLKIVTSVVRFRIRHRPLEQLKIRIGIHSGPVVAGVVGLKMPRYCLFGDTVNYASRMESTGVRKQRRHVTTLSAILDEGPQRIHVSPECKAYLDVLGGFILEERGPVEMKGKGVISTYFLIGKTVDSV